MKTSKLLIFASILPVLAGCTTLTRINDDTNPPLAFHDTLMQYALLTGESATLSKNFGMKPPSLPERIVAGVVLPITAATEATFFPFFTGIKTESPSQY